MKNARTGGVALRRGAMALYAVLAVGAVLAAPAGATGPTPITDCSSNGAPAAIAADFEAGGSYIFECGTTRSFVDFTSTIAVSTDLTVTAATGQPISLLGYVAGGRFMTIESGTVSLSDLYISAFTQASAPLPLQTPVNGKDGINGKNGTNGAAPGDNGTDGTAGDTGGAAPNGADGNANGPAEGGALLVDAGATVTLTDDTFNNNEAYGQEGGDGGAGGFGGYGGSGGTDGTTASASDGNGGNGGAGGNGGTGGYGGNGGNAEGGAIYNAGDLTVTGTTFSNNNATGGAGGWGGNGGGAWEGSYGGVGCDDDVYEGSPSGSGGSGGNGGAGGNAGAGGNGGNAQGGAIYNTGMLTLASGNSFSGNAAGAGRGGIGGNNMQSYDDSESDAGGGSYGGGAGGGPGGPAGVWVLADHDGDGPPTNTGCGSGGGGGAPGAPGASEPGGTAGNAQGGALYDDGTVDATAAVSFTSNTATGGTGGTGGQGGGGGGGGAGGNQPGDVQNEYQGDPFGATPGDNTSPTNGADGSDGGNGGNADSGAFVSTSKTLLSNAVCSGNGVAGGTAGGGGSGGAGGGAVYQSGQSTGATGTNGAAGTAGSSTNPQASCADELDVTVQTPADLGSPAPKLNDVVPVTIKVSAPSTNHDNVTAINFTGGAPLSWSPTPALTSTDDTNPSSFSLAPGTSTTVTVHVTVASLGTIPISSAVSGTDPQGTVTAAGQDTISPQGGLVVTVTVDKNPIKLANDADGNEIAQPITATVSIQNPLNVSVASVTLTNPLTTEKLTNDAVKVPVKQNGDPVFNSAPDPSGTIGTIPANTTEVVTVPFQAVGDGAAQIDAVVTYANPYAAGNLTSTGSVKEVVNPTELLALSYQLAPGEGIVMAGTPFSVVGTLTNVTNSAVVHVDPLIPALTGNVGGANPFDVDHPPPSVVQYVLPWSGALGGGDELSFQAVGHTVPGFGTRASISYAPTGTVDLPDGTSRDLTSADTVVIQPEDDQPVNVSIDDSVPPPTPASAISVLGNFTVSATQAADEWLQNTFSTVKSLGGAAADLVSTQHILSMVDTVEYLVDYYKSLTPAEQDNYMTQVATDVLEQTDRWGNTLAAVKAQVVSTVETWENQLLANWEARDWNAIASQLGQTFSNALLNVAIWFVHLPPAANAIRAADAATAATDAAKFASSVGQLIEGENLLTKVGSPLRTIFGLDDGQIQALIDLAKEAKVQIAIRFRNPKSAYWIEQFGALPKPEAIKLKSVSDLDIMFLGYPPGDEALAVLKKPISRAEVEANLAKHGVTDPDIKSAILQRWAQREKEYKELLPVYLKYQQEGIQVGFDYGAQGISANAQPSVFTRRAFNLAPVQGQQDTWVLEMANSSGTLKPITGDIDAVAISSTNGSILDEPQRIAAYKALQQINDAQHGATFDWFKNGELGSPTQLSLLAEHNPGKQLLAVFDPAGNVTAQYIDPTLTVIDKANQTGRIFYSQGYRMPESLPMNFSGISLPANTSPGTSVNPGFLSPGSWGLQGPGSNQAVDVATAAKHTKTVPGITEPTVDPVPRVPSLASCRWVFDRGPGAALAYPTGAGGLEVWTPGRGWRKLNSRECRKHAGAHASGPLVANRVLRVLPESSIADDVPAGSKTIAISSISQVVPGLKAGRTPWFEPGDKIVIDPGQANQELDVVASVSPFRLVHALRFAHQTGEMLGVYAA